MRSEKETRFQMATKDRKVPDHVLAMLEEMRADGDRLCAHPRKLDRKDYEDLNKVLAALGGKWKGGNVQAHVFPTGTDVATLIDNVLSSGRYEDPRDSDFIQTPEELTAWLVRHSGAKTGEEVLEPSAGHGRIAIAIRKTGATVRAIEQSGARCDVLLKHGISATCADFLKIEPRYKVDAVVMNPPFSKQQDIDHVRHAFGFLRPGGRLVAVMGAGTTFRTNKKSVEFRDWISSLGGTIEELPEATFKAEGTMVRAVVVSLRAPSL